MHKATLGIAIATLAAGCHQSFAPEGDTTVLSVVPAGGTTSVDPNGPIVVEFSHAMRMGMEQYVALHEGDVTGPVVPGTWSWSSDGLTLTFTLATPLKAQTQYTLHLGGGVMDANGNLLNYEHCTSLHGGQWATQSMMGGSMMGGSYGMMGSGWQHANGTYGMVFSFTTA
jgi:hypothetical protein